MPLKILVSAGEASGDLYAAHLVEKLRAALPTAEFFGCAGHHMRNAGVRGVVDASSLAVVGLFEVVRHIPRVYSEYRRLVGEALRVRPALAILTDSPDFHLRVAQRLKRNGIPVVYLVAPQVWAWRQRRIHSIQRNVDRLLCIFPFEEKFFRRHGVAADYIGHPLARMVKALLSKTEFFRKHDLQLGNPLIVLLPGSRPGEIARHMPPLLDAVDRMAARREASFVLACPPGVYRAAGLESVGRQSGGRIRVVEGETWDALAHADLALAASGTVTIEAALLETPMVTFYRVSEITWRLGGWLVDVPYYSMVNLVAGRSVVPELMQNEVTGERLATEALRLLENVDERERMRQGLREVRARLATDVDPLEKAAQIVQQLMKQGVTNVS